MKKLNIGAVFIISCILAFSTELFPQVVKSEKTKIRINTLAMDQNTSPAIKVISPESLRPNQTFISMTGSIPLILKIINPEEGIRLYVNNIEVPPTSEGNVYLKTIDLLINRRTDINISLYKNEKLLNEYLYSVIYTPQVRNNSPLALNSGKYYAVIIGNGAYNDPGLPNLKRPVADAKALKDVLTTRYTFNLENLYFLIDKNLENIILVFDELQRKLTEDDNLLIFYAGHGQMDENSGLGYWLFSDATLNSTFRWFANSRLTDYIKSFKARHILLIADACYAGSIYESRGVIDDAPVSIQDVYKSKSRQALTSGGTSKVSDDSKFAEYLIEQLKENSKKYLISAELYNSILVPVKNNSENLVRWAPIQNVGDKGGDFVFILRDN